MEAKIGKLKGTAYRKGAYLFKKNHPIRWWVREKLQRLVRFIY